MILRYYGFFFVLFIGRFHQSLCVPKQLHSILAYIIMEIRKHLRLIAGIFALIIGVTFSIVPVIPVLGIAGLFIGAFLLAPYIPILNKFKNWLKKKDSHGHTEKTEEKLNELEKQYGEQDGEESQEQENDSGYDSHDKNEEYKKRNTDGSLH